MCNWRFYIATGSVCPPVVGMKPTHPNFVLQLSQPTCEQTEFVVLGEPQVERCKTDLCSKHHCSFHSRTSSSYLCRSFHWLSFHRDSNPAALGSHLLSQVQIVLVLLLCTLNCLVWKLLAKSQQDCEESAVTISVPSAHVTPAQMAGLAEFPSSGPAQVDRTKATVGKST